MSDKSILEDTVRDIMGYLGFNIFITNGFIDYMDSITEAQAKEILDGVVQKLQKRV